MIQADFNFEVGDAGDWPRVQWLFGDLLKTASEAFESGNHPAAIRDLVRAQKLVGCGSLIGSFVRDSIAPSGRGDSMTTAEAWAAYEVQMDRLSQPYMSKGLFEKLLPSAMSDVHGVAKSNGVIRNGTARRGYRGCVLRGAGVSPLSPLVKKGASCSS